MFCISHIHSYYIHPYIYINTTIYSHIVYSIRYQSTHTRTPLEQSTHTHIELQYIWLMKVQFSIYIPFFYNHDIANKANTNQDVIIQSTILQFHLVTLPFPPLPPMISPFCIWKSQLDLKNLQKHCQQQQQEQIIFIIEINLYSIL